MKQLTSIVFMVSLVLAFSGCKTNSLSGSRLLENSSLLFPVVACVDSYGSEKVRAYKTLIDKYPNLDTPALLGDDIVIWVIEKCDQTIDAYIEKVVASVKAKNGWSSVRPAVRPAIKKDISNRIQDEFRPSYRLALSSNDEV